MKPSFDFGQQALTQLRVVLGNALELYGLPAQVFAAIPYNNEYTTIKYAQEHTVSTEPTGACKVLLGQPFRGLDLNGDFISLSDKVSEQMRVTTLYPLQINDQLRVLFPDKKEINMVITESQTIHPGTQMAFSFIGRVQ